MHGGSPKPICRKSRVNSIIPKRRLCFRLTIPRIRGAELTSSPLELPPVEGIDELEEL